jgi:DNA-binding CsgD family transcriptional regulator
MGMANRSRRRHLVHATIASGSALATRREALEPLLLDLHATTNVKELWPALQALLGAAFSHHSIVLGLQFVRERGPSIMLHSRPLPLRTPEWYDQVLPVHPGLAWLENHPGARLVRVSDVQPVAALKASDYFRMFMQPEGWLHGLGFFYWNEEGIENMIGVNRAEDQGDFNADDLAVAESLYHQIGVVLRRIARLNQEAKVRDTLASYLMDLPLPAMYVDWHLRPIYTNHAAREMLLRWANRASGSAPAKLLRRPQLPADLRLLCQSLRKTIQAGDRTNTSNAANRSQQVRAAHPPQPRSFVTNQNNHTNRDLLSKPGFWITWMAPETVPSTTAGLGNWKLLSRRERDVALRLFRGESNHEISQALGRSISTIKSHLESMFRKAGVKNRAGLLAHLRGPV